MPSELVLSLFPGIDLFGRAFEAEGFCVVRGPDLLWGQDVRDFHCVAGKFDGVVGGSPCQDFSKARRCAPTGEGLAMLREFERVVLEARPSWWLLENVPSVPDLVIDGYGVTQRLDVRADECGSLQKRLRHFQWGHVSGRRLLLKRGPRLDVTVPAAMAREGALVRSKRRTWAEFCALQGVTELELPSFTKEGRYRAVGNGVPLPMGRALAAAVRDRAIVPDAGDYCECGCGRWVAGRQLLATVACRKREQRRRDAVAVSDQAEVDLFSVG